MIVNCEVGLRSSRLRVYGSWPFALARVWLFVQLAAQSMRCERSEHSLYLSDDSDLDLEAMTDKHCQ